MKKRTLFVKYVKRGLLKKYEKNPRFHSSDQIAQIVASMERYGFTNPVLIDENNEIIAGHGRIEAANRLGIEQIPTIMLSGLSDAERKAYVIADNKLADNASWNNELLAECIQELVDANEASLSGFTEPEIAQLVGNVINNPLEEWEKSGMPTYTQNDAQPFRTVLIHFADQEALDDFIKTTKLKILPDTKFAWFPTVKIERIRDGGENLKEYVSE